MITEIERKEIVRVLGYLLMMFGAEPQEVKFDIDKFTTKRDNAK